MDFGSLCTSWLAKCNFIMLRREPGRPGDKLRKNEFKRNKCLHNILSSNVLYAWQVKFIWPDETRDTYYFIYQKKKAPTIFNE